MKSASMSMLDDKRNDDSLLRDFLAFLRQHKVWWLVPLMIVAAIFAVLIVLSGRATTPFIYTAH
jgi:Family of unknown function (DUF5989)